MGIRVGLSVGLAWLGLGWRGSKMVWAFPLKLSYQRYYYYLQCGGGGFYPIDFEKKDRQ